MIGSCELSGNVATTAHLGFSTRIGRVDNAERRLAARNVS
jgi:hypothetical protein